MITIVHGQSGEVNMARLIDEEETFRVLSDYYKHRYYGQDEALLDALSRVPTAQPEEVIPHRNYKYLSDYWCECGWHLGKRGNVKYCPDCGRKVKWDG
jgi:hypothetical protein